MFTRNRTREFTKYRDDKKSQRRILGNSVEMESFGHVSDETLLSGNTNDFSDHKITVPPSWVSSMDEVSLDIERIKKKIKELGKLHQEHLLKPSFDEDERRGEEQEIEIRTSEITKMFQKCRGKVMKIGKLPNLSKQEDFMRNNMQASLATQLQELSGEFRKSQQDYLERTRRRAEKGKDTMFSMVDNDIKENVNDRGFTDMQQMQVDASREQVQSRRREVEQIAKSISELAEIFNDLAILVVDQGTVLDRIDYNIISTDHHVQEANEELDQANEYQKGARTKMCIIFVCVGILALIIALIIKVAI